MCVCVCVCVCEGNRVLLRVEFRVFVTHVPFTRVLRLFGAWTRLMEISLHCQSHFFKDIPRFF